MKKLFYTIFICSTIVSISHAKSGGSMSWYNPKPSQYTKNRQQIEKARMEYELESMRNDLERQRYENKKFRQKKIQVPRDIRIEKLSR